MKDLPFGPTAPYQVTGPVTEFQVKEELDRIGEEIEPQIGTPEIPLYETPLGYDRELDAIFAYFPAIVDDLNVVLKYEPEVDWRAYLRKMVDHELAHRNQTKYLSKRGISLEQQSEPQYLFLREFQAYNAVRNPVWKRVYSQDMRSGTFEQVEELLESPHEWARSVIAFSREDMREVFGPHGADEAMLKLKDIAEKIITKEDIMRYATFMKRRLGLSQ